LVEVSNHVTAVIPHITKMTTGRAVKCRPAMWKMQTIDARMHF